jgi:hypothetical protein
MILTSKVEVYADKYVHVGDEHYGKLILRSSSDDTLHLGLQSVWTGPSSSVSKEYNISEMGSVYALG